MMSDSYYQLRKPVKILKEHKSDTYSECWFSVQTTDGHDMLILEPSRIAIKNMFVEVDLEQQRTAITDEIDYAMDKAVMNHVTSEATDSDGSYIYEQIRDTCVREVLALFYPTRKETTDEEA